VASFLSLRALAGPDLLAGSRAKRVVLEGLLIFILLGCSLTGCARHRQVTRVPRISEYEKNEQVFGTNEEAVKAGVYEEFIDSMLLKGQAPSSPAVKKTEAVVPVPPPVAASGELPADIMIGFRVQLGAFGNQQSAEQAASQARVRLGPAVQVHVRYYEPLWKVQAGDCRTKQEAETLRNTLRKIGYPDAWIVSSGIKR